MPEPGARRRRGDWRYRAWRQAELPLLVDDPACVQTTALAVPEADPAVACVAQTDDVLERLEPALRRVLHARAAVGDEQGLCRGLERALRLLARAEPEARFVAAIRSRRNGPLVFRLVHDQVAVAAVPLSRARVHQVVAGTLVRWGRARFPALLAWWDAERATARRVRVRPRRAPAPAPAGLVEVQRPDPDPADWLRILASVRPVPHA